MNLNSYKIIAVDFDGTLVKHEFPEIGDEVPGAFTWLRNFQEQDVRLILWTMRAIHYEVAAVNFCRERGVEFWGVNINPEQSSWTTSPKAYAQVYIDDAAFGCPLVQPPNGRPYADWSVIGPAVMKWIKTETLEVIHPREEPR